MVFVALNISVDNAPIAAYISYHTSGGHGAAKKTTFLSDDLFQAIGYLPPPSFIHKDVIEACETVVHSTALFNGGNERALKIAMEYLWHIKGDDGKNPHDG